MINFFCISFIELSMILDTEYKFIQQRMFPAYFKQNDGGLTIFNVFTNQMLR